jgi:hypothetical protein
MFPRRTRNGGLHGNLLHQKAEATKVYLFLKYDGATWIECELYDDVYKGSDGKIPAELHLQCPHCGGESVIPPTEDSEKKHLRIEYLDKPRRLEMPDNGEVVFQTVVISVEEPCRCGHPAPNGKGLCAWKFRIQDNVVTRA